jgi:putative ABC transport system permease protein
MLLRANLMSALEQIRCHLLRALLTVLGIVIAVAATITIVSVVQGFTVFVGDFLQSFATNAMWIWPERPQGGRGRPASLTLNDVRALREECPAIARTSPLYRREGVIGRIDDRTAPFVLEGVGHDYDAIRNYAITSGRFFALVDVEQAQPVCVVGHATAHRLDPSGEPIGRALWIDGHRFEVVGVLEEKGSFFGISQDDLVLMPHSAMTRAFPAIRRRLAITAQATSEQSVGEARAQAVSLLRRRLQLDPTQPTNFQARTQDEVLRMFQRMTRLATIVLAAIAGLSLLVGGIGIMNVMLVSVTERTREIGLRKAVGARRRDILAQFLIEAVALSALGGAVGVGLGLGLCQIASLHPRMVDVVAPWWAIGLGFGISAGTGVLFGLLPAVKAALLSPIDALRHE